MLEFFEIELPAITVAGLRETVEMSAVAQHVGPLFERVAAAMGATGVPRLGPSLATYSSTGGQPELMVITVGEQLDPQAPTPSGLQSYALESVHKALCYRTSIDTIGEIQGLWANLFEQIETRGYAGIGACREIYHHTPTAEDNFWTIELQQPVRSLSAWG